MSYGIHEVPSDKNVYDKYKEIMKKSYIYALFTKNITESIEDVIIKVKNKECHMLFVNMIESAELMYDIPYHLFEQIIKEN